MTKKHFIALAQRFRVLRDENYGNPEILDGIAATIGLVADVCEIANENFDRNRFYNAIYMAENESIHIVDYRNDIRERLSGPDCCCH